MDFIEFVTLRNFITLTE